MTYYKSLAQFYNSTEWRKFRQLVIAERISPKDGILYDEYSGKALLRPQDIILHHKIELTLQNVNDSSISLNPDNIMIVSMQSHNEIHNRFGGRLKDYQRKVYYVYGSPCSGKSTYVRENMQAGDLVFDIDKLWQALSGQPAYVKPNELTAVVMKTRDSIIDSINARLGRWQSAFIIEGGALYGDRQRRIDKAGAESIFISATKEDCYTRLASDKERISVYDKWTEYIDKWFEMYQPDIY